MISERWKHMNLTGSYNGIKRLDSEDRTERMSVSLEF